jgi:hypothetical protein
MWNPALKIGASSQTTLPMELWVPGGSTPTIPFIAVGAGGDAAAVGPLSGLDAECASGIPAAAMEPRGAGEQHPPLQPTPGEVADEDSIHASRFGPLREALADAPKRKVLFKIEDEVEAFLADKQCAPPRATLPALASRFTRTLPSPGKGDWTSPHYSPTNGSSCTRSPSTTTSGTSRPTQGATNAPWSSPRSPNTKCAASHSTHGSFIPTPPAQAPSEHQSSLCASGGAGCRAPKGV